MKDLISIIVPVYNVENYIDECIESILNQNYENIEIILIDDGSLDKSGEICDTYAKKDNRINVIHKKNGGLSDARNIGINNANGQYIAFIDGDDYVAKDYISSMYNNIKKYNVKISACGFVYVYTNNEIIYKNFRNIEHLYIGDEAQIYLNTLGYFNVSSCNKLFKKELFNDICFPKGKKSEDWFIMYKLIEKSGKIYYSSNEKYFYRQRDGSITKNIEINEDCIQAAEEVYFHFKDNNNILPYAVQSLVFACIGVYNSMLYIDKKKNKKKMNEIRKKVCDLKKLIILNNLEKTRKIQIFLFINFSKLYNIIFLIYKRKINKKIYNGAN